MEQLKLPLYAKKTIEFTDRSYVFTKPEVRYIHLRGVWYKFTWDGEYCKVLWCYRWEVPKDLFVFAYNPDYDWGVVF